MKNYLNRETILSARPRAEDVEIPGLGVVRVRGLTAAERGVIESMVVDFDPMTQSVTYNAKKAQEMNVRLAAFGLVDAEGKQMFNPNNPKDLAELGQVAGDVLGTVAEAVRRLSGMGEAAEKKGHA